MKRMGYGTRYCGNGTEFTPSDNIQWNDPCCLPAIDRSRIYNASAGDILFIKGAAYSR